MNDPFAVFRNIKLARVSAGFSQTELARQVGVSGKTISAYETGRAIPPSQTLVKISRVTKVPLHEILEVEDENLDAKILQKLEAIEIRLERIENEIKKRTN